MAMTPDSFTMLEFCGGFCPLVHFLNWPEKFSTSSQPRFRAGAVIFSVDNFMIGRACILHQLVRGVHTRAGRLLCRRCADRV